MLALTWAFRTFHGTCLRRNFLADTLPATRPTALESVHAKFENPYPRLAWILGQYTSETENGVNSGLLSPMPAPNGPCTGFTFCTNLQELQGFPRTIARPAPARWEVACAARV